MNVSVLVPAHNEAANIEQLLTSLLAQETREARIIEIVIVASGCTDNTADLARKAARGKPGMHVVVQERRAGKVAAINEYLRVRDKRAEVVVVSSADLRVAPDVVEKIVLSVERSQVRVPFRAVGLQLNRAAKRFHGAIELAAPVQEDSQIPVRMSERRIKPQRLLVRVPGQVVLIAARIGYAQMVIRLG